MLPMVIDDSVCRHIKIYDEATLNNPAVFRWDCLKCSAQGVGDRDVEFIYTHKQIQALRRKNK